MAEQQRATFPAMSSAVLLAWIGMVIHNLADLPIALHSHENVLPGAVWIVLLVAWRLQPATRWPAILLSLWGSINIAGAVFTVLPISLLPFQPEQSLRHYAFHVLYLSAQLPLLRYALIEAASGATVSLFVHDR